MRHLLVLTCVLVLFSACARKKDYGRPLPPGTPALVELRPGEWPRFRLPTAAELPGIAEAIDRSLHYLAKKSAKKYFPMNGIGHDQVVRGLTTFKEVLRLARTEDQLNGMLTRDFRCFRSVGWDGSGEVLFTGYYTPIFQARLEPDRVFRYPIYQLPADLRKGATHNDVATQVLPGGGTRPYPGRAELERTGALRGLELAWLADPFDAYIINVQGSARLVLGDGRTLEVGYAGTNGHRYVSVNHALVKDGRIGEDECNLATMRAFFRRHPQLVAGYINRNQRLVFFKPAPGGPFGCLGEKVTDHVSMATDKDIFPRAALCYVIEAREPKTGRRGGYAGFRLDQDRGGAIVAPGRADLFMGIGEHAERVAGRKYSEGYLFYLVAK